MKLQEQLCPIKRFMENPIFPMVQMYCSNQNKGWFLVTLYGLLSVI